MTDGFDLAASLMREFSKRYDMTCIRVTTYYKADGAPCTHFRVEGPSILYGTDRMSSYHDMVAAMNNVGNHSDQLVEVNYRLDYAYAEFDLTVPEYWGQR